MFGGYYLVTLPEFRVHVIDIQITGRVTSRSQILAAADIDRRQNMWLLDTARIARRIESIPYVDRAVIRRRMPAQVDIAVTEREPIACVRAAHADVTVDRQQRILQTGCAQQAGVRIELAQSVLGPPGSTAADPGLSMLLNDVRTLTDARISLRSINHDPYGQIVAVDSHGIGLLFGDDADLRAKAKLVEPVLLAAPSGRRVRTIDLRAPATPIVKFDRSPATSR